MKRDPASSDVKSEFLHACQRVLGLIDHNPFSQTAGSSDRSYWHYLDSKSFEVASPLVSMLALGSSSDLLEDYDFAVNAAELQLGRWTTLISQRKLLDEYYGNQESFCASAYTAMAAAWHVTRTSRRRSQTDQKRLVDCLHRAIWGLAHCKNRPQSANQSLAARLACSLARALDSKRNWPTSDFFEVPVDIEEGVLLEYDGFDLGYSLKCVDLICLGLLSSLPSSENDYLHNCLNIVLRSLEKFVVFSTFDTSLGSRGNGHQILGGLRLLSASGSDLASSILSELTNRTIFQHLIPATNCDDKYLSFFHMTSLYLAGLSCEKSVSIPLNEHQRKPKPRQGHIKTKRFFVLWADNLRVCASIQSGGILCFEDHNGHDVLGGFICKSEDQAVFVSPAPGVFSTVINEEFGKWRWALLGMPFKQKTQIVQSLPFSILFRIAMRVPVLSSWLRKQTYRLKRETNIRTLGEFHIAYSDYSLSLSFSLAQKFIEVARVWRWSFTDGHATRLFGDNVVPFQFSERDFKFRKDWALEKE